MQVANNKGFTLVELMIVIAIIGILAGVAIPGYTSYMARGKIVEAGIGLSAYRTSMEQFYQDQRTYAASGTPTVCGAALPASSVSNFFIYGCVVTPATATTSQSFLATASSVAGKGLGVAGDYVFTIDDSNLKTTQKFKGVVIPAATGTGCFIGKEGQKC